MRVRLLFSVSSVISTSPHAVLTLGSRGPARAGHLWQAPRTIIWPRAGQVGSRSFQPDITFGRGCVEVVGGGGDMTGGGIHMRGWRV